MPLPVSAARKAARFVETPMTTAPKPARKKARDPDAFKSVITRMNADGWRALRILAAENDTTLNALAVEAFNDLLKKYGKRASIENPLLD